MKMAKYLQISAMALSIPVLASCAGTNNLPHETRTQARTLQKICTEAFNKKGDNFYIRRFIGGECVESYHFGGIEILIYQPSPDNPFEASLCFHSLSLLERPVRIGWVAQALWP